MNKMRPSDFKNVFFDRKKVINSTDRAILKVLSRFGAFVRRTARGSIRKRRRSSKPGQAPSNRTGLLKRFIFFGYDNENRSVVIGPAKLNSGTNAPHVLEYGGKTTVKTKKKRHKVKIQPRPYMNPAFEKEKKTLPSMWRKSVR